MALQLWTLLTTKNVDGISLGMMGIFLYVQITFAQVGYRDKSWALFWGMVLSALLTSAIIALVVYARFLKGNDIRQGAVLIVGFLLTWAAAWIFAYRHEGGGQSLFGFGDSEKAKYDRENL